MDSRQISGKGEGNISLRKIRKQKLHELAVHNKCVVLRVFKTIVGKTGQPLMQKDVGGQISKKVTIYDLPSEEEDTLVHCCDLCLSGSNGDPLVQSFIISTLFSSEAIRITANDVTSDEPDNHSDDM